jgi:hypothetical protein
VTGGGHGIGREFAKQVDIDIRSQSYDFWIYSYNVVVCRLQERFYSNKKIILKTRHANSCAVKFCNAGVVTQGRKIGPRNGINVMTATFWQGAPEMV